MRIVGFTLLTMVLLGYALVLNAPILLMLFMLRRRIPRVALRMIVCVGFAAVGGYMLWRMEWFDVWRHGVPSAAYLVNYVYSIGALAAIGWLVGSSMSGQEQGTGT